MRPVIAAAACSAAPERDTGTRLIAGARFRELMVMAAHASKSVRGRAHRQLRSSYECRDYLTCPISIGRGRAVKTSHVRQAVVPNPPMCQREGSDSSIREPVVGPQGLSTTIARVAPSQLTPIPDGLPQRSVSTIHAARRSDHLLSSGSREVLFGTQMLRARGWSATLTAVTLPKLSPSSWMSWGRSNRAVRLLP